MGLRPKPPGASIATDDGNKMFAPAAARNCNDITALLQSIAPVRGSALEIASGTGQHITAFARAMPDMFWTPTELDPARLISIAAYTQDCGLDDIAVPQMLDATEAGWGVDTSPQDLICVVNLLHLISTPECETMIAQAALALKPSGVFMIYGPFKRNGQLTSAGDQRFDAQLRADQPDIGYKDDQVVVELLKMNGLTLLKTVDMPANNLAIVGQKPW